MIHNLIMMFFIFIFSVSFSTLNAQIRINNDTSLQRKLYTDAYFEISDMLKEKKQLSLKRAVFIIENAFIGGTMNYQDYTHDVARIGDILKQMIKDKQLEKFKTAGNWATFTYMTDSIVYNNYKPYIYDFKDFFGDSSWTSQFVTKLLVTKVGQCHSLPLLYKILCNEIGASAHIAFAPNHLYIKHKDENGKWINLEMTNGSFSRDEWIMEQSDITAEQIQSGIYMNVTTEKQLISFMLFDLQNCYHRTFGCDEFNLLMIETGLIYFPTCINLQLAKEYHYQQNILKEQKKKVPNKNLLSILIKNLKDQDEILKRLAYTEEIPEHYVEWIESVELEKTKRNIK